MTVVTMGHPRLHRYRQRDAELAHKQAECDHKWIDTAWGQKCKKCDFEYEFCGDLAPTRTA